MSKRSSRQKNKNNNNNNKSARASSRRINFIPAGTPATALALATQSSASAATSTAATDSGIMGAATAPAPLMGGRQTQPYNANPIGAMAYGFLPRRNWESLDLTDLSNATRFFTPQQLLEMLADLQPQISQATNNKVRLVNIGWSFQVKTKNGTSELKAAKARVDAFLANVNKDGGGIDAIINGWSSTAFLQGAVAGEIALTEDLNEVADIYSVQPWTIWFERDSAQNLVPFQQQVSVSSPVAGSGAGAGAGAGQRYGVAGYPYRRLNPTTFGYVPVDEFPDGAYGRAMAGPALQLVNFYFQMLKDMRQWVHVNAWGRLHIKMMEEMILKAAPATVKNDPSGNKQIEFINARLTAFRTAYNTIKPDDAFVSTDAVAMSPVDSSGKTFDVGKIFDILKAELFSALKELPVFMGSNTGTTETHGTVQMAIYAATIKSLQKVIAALIEKLLNAALAVWGINGKVVWTFEPLRATDRLMDAQADQAETAAAAAMRDQGWITQDEASIRVTGSEAVSPEPTYRPSQAVNFQMQGQEEGNKNNGQQSADAANAKSDSANNGQKPDGGTDKSNTAEDDAAADGKAGE